MWRNLRLASLLLCLLLLASSALGASRASFCKCTCKKNSTIIPLDGHLSNLDPPLDDSAQPRAKTCNDCNRQFCIDYRLPILAPCQSDQSGKEEEIFTTCFQRDSAKDQTVVYSFILVTVGLLIYAVVEPYLQKRRDSTSAERRPSYTPVPPTSQGLDS